MKNWIKTLLCIAATATLVACGDGDDAPAAAAGGGGGGTVSAAAFTSLSAGLESAAGFAIDGVDAGFYGNFNLLLAPSGLETPAAPPPSYSAPSCTNSATGGAATYEPSESVLTYTNCKIGDATLNGKAKIVRAAGSGTASYTITFDTVPATPLTITGQGSDGKTATFTYTGTQVVTNLQGEPGHYTGAKITLNATVKIGSSSTVKFTNLVVEYGPGGTNIERTTVNGKYGATIKLADFGIPATPGAPETVEVTLDVTTPTPIDYNYVTDKDVAGVMRFSYAGVMVIEIDYGARKVRVTATGSPTQEFPM